MQDAETKLVSKRTKEQRHCLRKIAKLLAQSSIKVKASFFRESCQKTGTPRHAVSGACYERLRWQVSEWGKRESKQIGRASCRERV